MIHLHLTTIVLAVILYVIALVFYQKSGPGNAGKMSHMILRADYIFLIFSGLIVYIQNMEGIGASGGHMMYGLKVLFGLGTVALMEMSLIKAQKKTSSANTLKIIAIIVLVITVALGIYLPLGPLSSMF
ncbi:YisL family protein [Salinicoccus sp. YB14-2]|uniref:YisL family protein n=1 Tax=Salinicoccus sp. YB14-2 TaxID=1572701 RepID=UPI00068A340D|nr:YisL family protein [Salinicoccus sp. YB14-2]